MSRADWLSVISLVLTFISAILLVVFFKWLDVRREKKQKAKENDRELEDRALLDASALPN